VLRKIQPFKAPIPIKVNMSQSMNGLRDLALASCLRKGKGEGELELKAVPKSKH
jgi:hypothetical protein